MGYVWIPTQASWTIDMVGRLPAKTHQWRTLWHENPYYQWNVATGPNLRFQVGNERIVLNRGDCLLLQPGTRHTGWGPDEDGTGFYFIRWSSPKSGVKCSSRW
jgi:quercetin dioxygenase-like cupin family protein